MNNSLLHFDQWRKSSPQRILKTAGKKAVVYTRVSSKEQFDKNLSLDWQRKTIDDFASRNQFEVLDFLEELLKVRRPMAVKNSYVC